jgi:hypothetical protein
MASLLERAGAFLDRVFSVPIPEAALKPSKGAVYKVERSDGTTPGAAVARPDINKQALAGKDLDFPDAGSEMWNLTRDLTHRGNPG